MISQTCQFALNLLSYSSLSNKLHFYSADISLFALHQGNPIHAHPFAVPYVSAKYKLHPDRLELLPFLNRDSELSLLCLFKITVPFWDTQHSLRLQCTLILRSGEQESSQSLDIVGKFVGVTNRLTLQGEYLEMRVSEGSLGGIFVGSIHSVNYLFKFKSNEEEIRQLKLLKEVQKKSNHIRKVNEKEMLVITTIQDYFLHYTDFQSKKCLQICQYYKNALKDAFLLFKAAAKQLPLSPTDSQRLQSIELPVLDLTKKRKNIFQDLIKVKICTVDQLFRSTNLQDRKRATQQLMKECNMMSNQIYEVWSIFLKYKFRGSKEEVSKLKLRYQHKCLQDWGQKIISFTEQSAMQGILNRTSLLQIASQIQQKCRKGLLTDIVPFKSDQMSLKKLPVLVHQKFSTRKQAKLKQCVKQQLKHIYILVHGFMATHYDMNLVQAQIRYHNPNAIILLSACNEGRTSDDIQELAMRLAQETTGRLSGLQSQDFKLSFVGHSMGGIIIRAALPLLDKFRDHLQLYLSFGSPHLGYLLDSSALVDMGLIYINNMQKIKSIQQLTMEDQEQLKDTFLFKLAFNKGLDCFKKILLVSSPQDKYVPFQSSRIERVKSEESDSDKTQLVNEMVEAIWGTNKSDQLHRIAANFEIQSALEQLIGRKAHIMFLSDYPFLKIFFSLFQQQLL